MVYIYIFMPCAIGSGAAFPSGKARPNDGSGHGGLPHVGSKGGNFQGNFLVVGEGFRVELLGRAWHGAFGVGGAIIRSGQ